VAEAKARVVLRDVPLICEVEVALHRMRLKAPSKAEAEEFSRFIGYVARETFGIDEEDLGFSITDPDALGELRAQVEAKGWDLNTAMGEPMLAFDILAAPIAAVAMGLGGHYPDGTPAGELSDDAAENLEARLRDEALRFRSGRKD